MLAIRPGKISKRCQPNILPCQIKHDGPVNASRKYWAPTRGKDGRTVAYFRGRRLYARTCKIPAGYSGVVLLGTEKLLPRDQSTMGMEDARRDVMAKDGGLDRNVVEDEMADEADEDDDTERVLRETKIMEVQATFEEISVWGHEVVPEKEEDVYLRAVEEWIGFAEKMHSFEVPGEATERTG